MKSSNFFIIGSDPQVSWASQIWMVLAGVLTKDENKQLINQLLKEKPEVAIATPYMYHHLVEALLVSGEKELAIAEMKNYWAV
jgi:alpha-L-rhamnosidase